MATDDQEVRLTLRLPLGLRDRIKAYAKRQGRSINGEIVKALEREFPEPWSIEDKIAELLALTRVIKTGVNDSRVDKLAYEFEDTIKGMISGRVKGLDEITIKRVHILWEEYNEKKLEDWRDLNELDEEEERQMSISGTTAKHADPFEGE